MFLDSISKYNVGIIFKHKTFKKTSAKLRCMQYFLCIILICDLV